MIITSETQMEASEIYAAYHNLWRIEESFRVMKSQLDARPVYMQKQETLTGHFSQTHYPDQSLMYTEVNSYRCILIIPRLS